MKIRKMVRSQPMTCEKHVEAKENEHVKSKKYDMAFS